MARGLVRGDAEQDAELLLGDGGEGDRLGVSLLRGGDLRVDAEHVGPGGEAHGERLLRVLEVRLGLGDRLLGHDDRAPRAHPVEVGDLRVRARLERLGLGGVARAVRVVRGARVALREAKDVVRYRNGDGGGERVVVDRDDDGGDVGELGLERGDDRGRGVRLQREGVGEVEVDRREVRVRGRDRDLREEPHERLVHLGGGRPQVVMLGAHRVLGAGDDPGHLLRGEAAGLRGQGDRDGVGRGGGHGDGGRRGAAGRSGGGGGAGWAAAREGTARAPPSARRRSVRFRKA